MKKTAEIRLSCLACVTVLAIGGCAVPGARDDADQVQEPCRADCQLSFELPANVDERPRVQDVYHIAGGTELDFRIPGRKNPDVSGHPARTVLSFAEPAFLDRQGDPAYTLELMPGNNRFTARDSGSGVCTPPDGCRYVVINVGQPGRPSIISSPSIVIY